MLIRCANRIRTAAFLLAPYLCAQAPSSIFGQIVEGKITVGLLDRPPQVLGRSDIAKLPHATVRVKESGRGYSTYSGVPLIDLLKHAGVELKTGTQRTDLGQIVLVDAVEDSSVLFALAELDSTLTDKQVLLADTKDGKPLAAPEGPFRIIVPGDKEPARWARQVWAIYIVRVMEPPKRH